VKRSVNIRRSSTISYSYLENPFVIIRVLLLIIKNQSHVFLIKEYVAPFHFYLLSFHLLDKKKKVILKVQNYFIQREEIKKNATNLSPLLPSSKSGE
jgi:hypothetical protein